MIVMPENFLGSVSQHHRVGLFSIGLDTYWAQFDGLRERLEGYNRRIAADLGAFGVDVVNLGMIDTPEKAVAAGHAFRQSDVDLIFLHVATYALSATVLPVLRRAGVPVIVLNLSPEAAIDYVSFNQLEDRTKMTGRVAGALPGVNSGAGNLAMSFIAAASLSTR